MKYNIPVSKIEKLEKLIAKYNKKGAGISYERGEEVIEDGTLVYRGVDGMGRPFESRSPIKVRCVEVVVDGSYVINGWEFVGVLEYTGSSVVVRLADTKFSGKLPERFRDPNDMVCEHCHTIRNRKDLYVIHNVETDEYRKVGRQCLLEYTRGMDADVCASVMEALGKLVEVSDPCVGWDEFMGNGYDRSGYGMPRREFTEIAYAMVKRFGYVRKDTVNDILSYVYKNGMTKAEWDKRFGSLEMPSEAEMAEIDAYVAEEAKKDEALRANGFGSGLTEYMRNVVALWSAEYLETRDFAIVASFCNVFLGKVAKAKAHAEKASSEWVGKVGDKVEFPVRSARVLYTKDSYSYYGPCSYVWELIDPNGNVAIWSTTRSDLDSEGLGKYKLIGTVKGQSEYKGVKQTVLTRCKVEAVAC